MFIFCLGSFCLIVFWNNMSKYMWVCVYIAVNSYSYYIWIVNDLSDCNTFLFFLVCFLLFYFWIVCVMNSVCVSAAVSHACYIWIVNDITDSSTCLFSVAGFFLFCFRKVCVRKCVYVCLGVCVWAVNSPACYIWIVNDITDSNTCLFSVSVFFCVCSVLE